jgi:hypothetical protein
MAILKSHGGVRRGAGLRIRGCKRGKPPGSRQNRPQRRLERLGARPWPGRRQNTSRPKAPALPPWQTPDGRARRSPTGLSTRPSAGRARAAVSRIAIAASAPSLCADSPRTPTHLPVLWPRFVRRQGRRHRPAAERHDQATEMRGALSARSCAAPLTLCCIAQPERPAPGHRSLR